MAEPSINLNQALSSVPFCPAAEAGAGAPIPAFPSLQTRARLQLHRMRYFRDLLAAGFRHALSPDPQSRSLRAERIALGIDLPELDTVPLWSVRREDGAISIPFIEFLLGQIGNAIDWFCAEPALTSHEVAEELAAARRAITSLIAQASPQSEPASELPRLNDVYMSEGLLASLCGKNGFLNPVVDRCEAMLAQAHPASIS
jgi:hypothetical protein